MNGAKWLMAIPEPIFLYHITHIRNLASIIESGGILAHSEVRRRTAGYVDIAHDSIQEARERTAIRCGPGGFLHDYVPFYFAHRSPMLFAISRGNVEGYDEGQEPIIYLVARFDEIQRACLPFVFTDGHARMRISRFFDDPRYLVEIDWQIMRAKYWFITDDDPDRKRRRQAEFLVHNHLPWELITQIVTMTVDMKRQVMEIIDTLQDKPLVRAISNWYY